MSYQDRNTVVSIIISLLVNVYVIARLFQMNAAGLFDGPDAVTLWARMIVWIIPFGIAATIIGTILFNIGYAIVTNQPKPSFLVDERDRMIERRGMIAVTVFAMFGFIGSIIALAIGYSALVGFNIIYFAFAVASLADDLVKFVSYRAGI